MHPNLVILGALEIIWPKNYIFCLTYPNIQKFHLMATQQVLSIYYFWPNLHNSIFVPIDDFTGDASVAPACITKDVGYSRTFQILYKREEIDLQDAFLFKVYVLLDSTRVSLS